MPRNNIIIPEEFVTLIENSQTERLYTAGEAIYLEGDNARHFYYLKRGRIKIFVTSDNGTERTLTQYNEHTFFGEAAFFDGFPRMSSARAVTDCQVMPISRNHILEWFKSDPDLAFSMIASLAKTIRMLSMQINQLSFLPADKRVAHFLLEETKNGRSTITYTHEEIGAVTGSSRVTVSRILREFKIKKWIATGYGSIHITNREALHQFMQISAN